MEQRNREEIIQIKGDISHIKITTEDIKTGVAALVARAEQNGKEIVDLRGRVRELEHEMSGEIAAVKEAKVLAENEGEKSRRLAWKLFGFIAGGGSGALGLWEIFVK